ncbi:MAG: hypothetical protein N4A71_07990 [Carboxylicivirga sp.]|jgi:hypothetical protein|nr:hypothetical protein [Carboxylicivirga sp.]
MEKENLKKYPNAEKLEKLQLDYSSFNGNEVGRILNDFIINTKQTKFYYNALNKEIDKDNIYKFLKHLLTHGNFNIEQIEYIQNDIINKVIQSKSDDVLKEIEEQEKLLAARRMKLLKIKETIDNKEK